MSSRDGRPVIVIFSGNLLVGSSPSVAWPNREADLLLPWTRRVVWLVMDVRNPGAYLDDADRTEVRSTISIPDFVHGFQRGAPDAVDEAWCSRWATMGLEPSRPERDFSMWRVPRLQPMLWYRMHSFNPDGTVREGELLVAGMFERMSRVPDSIRLSHLLVFLRAGTNLAALGVSGKELAGKRLRASDLWGKEGRELEERLAAAINHSQRLRLMNEHFQMRYRRHASAVQTEVVNGVRHLLANPRIADVAELSGWSSRHLERLFNDHIGISPKRASLVLRAGNALRSGLGSSHADWARIALDHAFADQAHLTRTMRTLLGTPPARLLHGIRNGGHWLDGLLMVPDGR